MLPDRSISALSVASVRGGLSDLGLFAWLSVALVRSEGILGFRDLLRPSPEPALEWWQPPIVTSQPPQ